MPTYYDEMQILEEKREDKKVYREWFEAQNFEEPPRHTVRRKRRAPRTDLRK